MLPKLALLILAACSTALADITGSNPASGTCLCIAGSGVRVRSSPCGSSVIGSESTGRCFISKGKKQNCRLGSKNYDFFLFNYNGKDGWSAGTYLNKADPTRCSSGGNTQSGYTCSLVNKGKRVGETSSVTQYDCRDKSCKYDCKGGQCVAYVKCFCKRGGKAPPGTGCWSPGVKVVDASGKCNRKIPPNTAIATFSDGKYYGHAAVFIRCEGDYVIRVYDQWCARALDYSNYGKSSNLYNKFAVITSKCPDVSPPRCRVNSPGSQKCQSYSQCRRKRSWYGGEEQEE